MSDNKGANASTDRFSPIDGPYTCCESTLSRECIGFHITAPKHGSIHPLVRHERTTQGTEEDPDAYTPQELRDTGRLLAASWDLLKALEYARKQMRRSGFCFEMDDAMYESGDPEYRNYDGYRSIDAAIAKAKGLR